jgi:hypothetical protein
MIHFNQSQSKPSNLEFDMVISGLVDMAQPIVHFAIFVEGAKMSVLATRQNGNHYTVNLDTPLLRSLITPGDYECQFEVSIGDRHYVPLKDRLTYGVDTTQPTVTLPGQEPIPTPVQTVTSTPIASPTPTAPKNGSLFKSFEKEEKPKEPEKKKEPKKVVDLTIPEQKIVKVKKTSTVVTEESAIDVAKEVASEIIKDVTPMVLQKTRPTIIKKELI